MKLTLLAVALAVLGTNCGKKPPEVYRINHANGKPCAPDFRLVKDFFTEPDGSHEDACFAGPAPGTPIDIHVRVILDTPDREQSAMWERPKRAVVNPRQWREAAWIMRSVPRYCRRAALVVAAALADPNGR